MIILGQKYTFTEDELSLLQDDFTSIDYINYKDQDPKAAIKQIDQYLQEYHQRIIILNTKASISDELLTYLTKLELKGIKFLTISTFLEEHLKKCHIHEDQTDISFLENIKHFSTLQYLLKRLMDYTSALGIGLLASPIIIYSIYRIRKESPDGEILFAQQRVGVDGKEFKCFKFRSMIPNAENGIPQFASKNDSRIFPWGTIMRKNRFDELPQLWNVLKGDMHFIGPRPERQHWVNKFEKEIPYYNERHIIKPGITGWAQVKYPYGRNAEDAKQKLMYDLYYIKNWSLWFELKVIWKTIFVVIGSKGT